MEISGAEVGPQIHVRSNVFNNEKHPAIADRTLALISVDSNSFQAFGYCLLDLGSRLLRCFFFDQRVVELKAGRQFRFAFFSKGSHSLPLSQQFAICITSNAPYKDFLPCLTQCKANRCREFKLCPYWDYWDLSHFVLFILLQERHLSKLLNETSETFK